MGVSGAFRANSLNASSLGAMQVHEKREDLIAEKRRVREVAPLIYSPHGSDLDLKQSYEAHVRGANRNKGARNLCLHAFIQFPTDLELTRKTERLMLEEAARFVNLHHGGNAVFRARLDRDEAGRHGVDVFYAPRYEKKTAKGTAEWISLTKYGKELALAKFGTRPKTDKKTKEPVLDKNGKPVMLQNDNSYFQGRALQDLWFHHLRDEMNLDWVQRGEKKLGRDPDRLEPEEYKLKQERAKLDRQRKADEAIARERNQIIEHSGKLALEARDRIMATTREQEARSAARVASLDEQAERLEKGAEGLQEALYTAQDAKGRVAALEAKERALRASVAAAERYLAKTNDDAESAMRHVDELIPLIERLEAEHTHLKDEAQLREDGAANFEIAMQEVARVTSSAADMTLTNDLLEKAQARAFEDDWGHARRFAQDDEQDGMVVRFIQFGFKQAVALFEHIRSFTNFNNEIERARTYPEPLMQMQNIMKGMREAVAETLTQLGIADQRPDLGEVDKDGDPPPVLELVFTRADRKAKKLNNELAARLGPSGPSMR